MSEPDLQDAYPLTPAQQGILSHCLRTTDPTLYHSQVTFTLRGTIEIADLVGAWQRLVQSHEVLRTLFVWEDMDQPLQAVLRNVELSVDAEDWSGQASAFVDHAWQACVTEEMAQGFDLAEAPLCRLKIRRIASNELRVLWSYHHLILDGWSSQRLLSELLQLLDAAAEPQPRRPFKDYVAWRRKLPDAPAQDYWRSELEGFSEVTRLSLRSTMPSDGAEARFDRIRHALSESQTDALAAFGRRHKLTTSSLISFAWAVVLGRISRSSDVVFGITVAGRPPSLPGVDDSIGMYVNTLPVRVQLTDAQRAVAALQELQARLQQRGSFEHHALAEVQRQSSVPMNRPLFDSILVSHSFPSTFEPRGELGLSVEDLRYFEHSHFPLAVLFSNKPELEFQLVYRADALRRSEVQSLAQALERVLHEIAASDGERETGALTLAEAPALPDEANGPDAPILEDILRAAMTRRADALALVDNGMRLTYGGLDRRSQSLAERLIELDARAVAIRTVGAPAVIAMIAALRAGVCYVPLDPAWPRARTEQVLAAVGADLVLGRDADPLLGLPFLDIDAVAPGTAAERWQRVSPSAPAYVLFTSGSTGEPKPVAVSRGNLAYSTAARRAFYQNPLEAYLLLSALTFDSSVAGIYWTLASGGKLVLASESQRRDPDRIARLISDEGVTDTLCIPSLYAATLELAPPDALGTLERVIVAGEACPPGLLRQHLERCPSVALYNEYGPTEATVWATAARLTVRDLEAPVVPIGAAIPGSRVWVVDAVGQPLPAGLAGELVISGPGVVAEHARTLAAGERVYATGDLAYQNAEGAICFLGRLDRQVKVRGHRIDPAEIERSLESLPDVNAAVVIAETSGDAGTSLCAFWEGGCTLEAARAHLQRVLPKALLPRSLVPLPALPRNANGKLDRAALAGWQAQEDSQPEPQSEWLDNPDVEILVEAWKAVLGVPEVQLADDFFELGGDSIMALQVVARARRNGLTLAPNDLFEQPVLGELVELLREQGATGTIAPLASAQPQLLPIARWFFAMPLPNKSHWNMPALLRLADGVSPELLRQAVTAVHAAHEALRTRYVGAELAGTSTAALDWLELSLEEADLTPPASLLAAVQSQLSLSAGRLLRAAWIEGGDAQWLYLAAHHLAVDAVSWQLLLEEIDAAYQSLTRNQAPVCEEEAVSVGHWGAIVRAAAESGRFDPAIDYWQNASAHWDSEPAALELYGGGPEQNGTEGSAVRLVTQLDADRTARLHHDATSVGGVEVVLLAALAASFAEVLGVQGLPITLETHGRRGLPEVDLATTVGWLTAAFPFVLPVLDGEPERDLRLTEAARNAVPDGGISFGALRVAGRSGTENFADLPQVILNYLGRFEPAGKLSVGKLCDAESCLLGARPDDAIRPYRLEIGAESRAEGLSVSWSYSPDSISAELIERLAAAYLRHLERYVGALAAEPTAEADALADLDGLDDLLAELE